MAVSRSIIKRSRNRILFSFLSFLLLSLHPGPRPTRSAYAQDATSFLRDASTVKRLPVDRAGLGYPVRLQGIVTFYDPDWSVLYVQDSSGGIFVETLERNLSLTPGTRVAVEGISAPGSFLPIVSKAGIKPAGMAALPPARKIPGDRIHDKANDGEYIEITGIVHNSYQESPHQVVEVYAGSKKIRARVQGLSQAEASNLIDASIRIQGVLGINANAARHPIGLDLWVPGKDCLSIITSPPHLPAMIPVTKIADLGKKWSDDPPQHRIRITGTVMPGEKENVLLVHDGSGIITAKALFFRPITHGDSVDLIGFADLTSPVPQIIDATFIRIKANAIESIEEKGLPTLEHIREIRNLSGEEAKRGYPVRIRGVITYHHPQLSMTFIQDETGAVYIQSLDTMLDLEVGEKYELTGFSAPGDYAPIIVKPEFRRLGPAPMPEPKNVTMEQLASGQYDCLRVRMSGLVRSAKQVGNRSLIELFKDGEKIQVWTPNPADITYLSILQDAAITVNGICSIKVSDWGNISGFRLNVHSLDDIHVEKQAPFTPFTAPLRLIRNVFRYSNLEEEGHRVRIQGTVLHQQPGESLYIKDETGNILVPIQESLPVNPGDLIAVSGYPTPGQFSPSMEDARVKRLSTGTPPQPRILNDGYELNNNFHGDLVRIRAKLIDQWRNSNESSFILQDLQNPQIAFRAILQKNERLSNLPFIRNGSELELTGIYLLSEKRTERYGFTLLIRNPEDIRVLKNAPWWTSKHTFWMFVILFCLILSASIWGLLLKRRVKHQTKIIKERLESESALERKYRDLFEHSNDIVFSCTSAGKLISINPAGERILGYSTRDLIDLDLSRLIPLSSLTKIHEWIEAKRKGLDMPALECELLAKDGSSITVEISGEILIENGRVKGAQGIARDITERKRAEEALRQSEEKLRQGQKLEAIGRLAGGIAHDFNNILAAILGYAELSASEIPAGHTVSSNIDQIIQAGKRAKGLVQQILAFGRKLEQERQPVHLETILEETLKLIRASLPATIEIKTRIEPGCSPVLADSTQMHQVLLNLATNAAHAMRTDGGVLSFEISTIQVRNGIWKSYQPDLAEGSYLHLTVRDTGSGILPDIQKQIFEPYFTTKAVGEGSGLGLAVVHGIVQSHHGLIQVESPPGLGACFHIYLPCCQEKAQASPGQEEPKAVKGHGCILLVDDEESIVRLGKRSLTRLGYKVIGEVSSADALKKFEENPDQFDLVITDQTMPQLTGTSLAQAIWKIRPNFPIIICTGYSEQITAEKVSRMGFHALLNKPYTISELTAAIQRSLPAPSEEKNLRLVSR